MARVSDVPPDLVPADTRDVYLTFATAYGAFRDQVGVLAHVPPALKHLMGMLLELRERRNVPFRYIELAIVVVAKLNECQYCIDHHEPLLRIEGLSSAGMARLLNYADHPELDEIDRVVVEYAIAVTQSPQRISDRLFRRLRDHFTESQIVELTLRTALCGFFTRFNDALGIGGESEPHQLPVTAVPHTRT
jgi:AhpD family alkylhydroperoxidase